MAVFIQAAQANPTLKIRREDMRSMVCASLELFSKQGWEKHLSAPSTVWTSKKPPQKDASRVRSGLAKEQEEVYKTIRDKTMKRKRDTVYNTWTQPKKARSR